MNRTEILLKAADRLRAEFDASSVVEHAGIWGGEAEEIVRDFLNEHLPVTHETDPIRRQKALADYKKQVEADFKRRSDEFERENPPK